MMDIGIRKPPVLAIYWASPSRETIFFYLTGCKEEVEVQHRADPIGFSARTVSIDELSITGITWESTLITIYRLFGDLKLVRELDYLGGICEWVSRIIGQSWR